jgi:protein O-mannosyl-transferase
MAKKKIKAEFGSRRTGTGLESKSIQANKEEGNDKKGIYSRILVFVVLFITFLVFKPSLKSGFVNWDDYESLVNNVNLESFGNEWSWAAVKKIFTTDVLGAYIPLSSLSFAIEKYFFAPNPIGQPFVFHFTNLLIHLISTYLVFLLFSQLSDKRLPAIFGALIFGIHPMHVESVAWVTERKDVLYGMFFLLGLLAYIRYAQSDQRKFFWYGMALLFSVLSYFCKIQAVTLPLTMVVTDMILGRNWSNLKLLFLEKLPWWILSLVFGLINIHFLLQTRIVRIEGNDLSYGFFEKIVLAVYSYTEYLIKFLYPYRMSPIYPFPSEVPFLAYFYLIGVLLFFTALLIWSYRKKTYWLIYGLAFFTVNIIFMLQIVVAGQTFMSDRYTYIAYIGLIFICVKGISLLHEKLKSSKVMLYSFLVAYSAVLMYLSNKQVKVWTNTKKLWEHALTVFPNEKTALRNLGQYYLDDEKNYVKGINLLITAIEQDPENAAMYNNLGKAYTDDASSIIQNTPESIEKYQRMMRLSLDTYSKAYETDSVKGRNNPVLTAKILINRAVAKSRLGLNQEAIEDIDLGLKYDPQSKSGHSNKATIYFYLDQYEKAVHSFDAAIEQEPYNADLYFQRGMSKLEIKEYREALKDVEKAFSLNKEQPVYYLGRAQIYKSMGDEVRFLNDINSAKEKGVEVPEELLK